MVSSGQTAAKCAQRLDYGAFTVALAGASAGGADARWFSSALSRAGLGEAENVKTPCGMTRNETGRVLPARARGAGKMRPIGGERHGGLARGKACNWVAACIGKRSAGGLGRARAVLSVGEGTPWIWNVVADRWTGAQQLLDFYHASEPLWTPGKPCIRRRRRSAGSGWKPGCIACDTDRNGHAGGSGRAASPSR